MAAVPGARVGFTLDLPGTEAQTSRVELEGEEGPESSEFTKDINMSPASYVLPPLFVLARPPFV